MQRWFCSVNGKCLHRLMWWCSVGSEAWGGSGTSWRSSLTGGSESLETGIAASEPGPTSLSLPECSCSMSSLPPAAMSSTSRWNDLPEQTLPPLYCFTICTAVEINVLGPRGELTALVLLSGRSVRLSSRSASLYSQASTALRLIREASSCSERCLVQKLTTDPM